MSAQPDRSWKTLLPIQQLSNLQGFDWSNLPDVLKVEILLRLPDKPLTRLKCVSKDWYFLISNSCDPIISSPSPSACFCGFFYSCRDIRVQPPRNYLTIFPCNDYCNEYNSFPNSGFDKPRLLTSYRSFLPFDDHRPEDIQDCCNGLFLLARFGEYCVCNPTTCECVSIPVKHCHRENSESYFGSLVFDPTVSPRSFKIVRRPVRGLSSASCLELDVFSYNQGKNENNWTTYSLPVEENVIQGFGWGKRSVYLNGVLYMLSLAKFLFCIHLSIEHETDMTCVAVKLPGEKDDEFDECGSLWVVEGRLVYCNGDKFKILVWLLEDDGVHWKLQHRIGTINLTMDRMVHRSLYREGLKVYGFDPKTGEIFFGTTHTVCSYDPKTKELDFEPRVELPATYMIVGGQDSMFAYSRCTVILNRVIPLSSAESDLG